MTVVSFKNNICLPDKSTIKGSADRHLQTVQRTAIWPRGVCSGRHDHTRTWQSTRAGAGGPDTTSLALSPNHKEEKPAAKKTHFHRKPLNVRARAAAVTAEQCLHNPSTTPVPVRGAGTGQKHAQTQSSMKATE